MNDLVQANGGFFQEPGTLQGAADEPFLTIRVARPGDVRQTWTHMPRRARPTVQGDPIVQASGTGLTAEEARVPALAEGLERYCAATYRDDQFIRATKRELGSAAIELDEIPRCSESEYEHTNCPLIPANSEQSVRWVRALSLATGQSKFIPVVMTYLYAGHDSPNERFWLPITTGCAIHTSLERAILAGIFEVAERDAISIAWLQKLPLMRIVLDLGAIPAELAPYWERYQGASAGLEYEFFDATTDLALPTILGVQLSKHNKRLATLVSCCSAPTAVEAITKVMRDMVACRLASRSHRPLPNSWDDFKELWHGPTYMAAAERAAAFDFLLSSAQRIHLSKMSGWDASNPKRLLADVVRRFSERQLEILVADLSTDEALRCRLRAVRVLIPRLQPLAYHYRARYLGTPRLYEAPKNMGHRTSAESDLNPWPLPFA